MSSRTKIDTLIQGFQKTDPRLYDILRGLSAEIDFILTEAKSYTDKVVSSSTGGTLPILAPPGNFWYSLPGTVIKLTWDDVVGAVGYEIRKGFPWATANFVLRTQSKNAELEPLVTGSYTYLIKTINSEGVQSTLPAELTVNIGSISPVVITPSVIDNNVLLYWTTPELHPFNIVGYKIYRDGTEIGTQTGTFTTIFETSAGTYNYSVRAYDLAGNLGEDSTVTVVVNQPPDFVLLDTYTSVLNGTVVSGVVESGYLYAPIDLTHHYDDHFTDNSWASPQAQVTAGYPLYIQPTEDTASYTETFDFGLILSGIVISINWIEDQLASDTVDVSTTLEYSDDNSTWSSPVSGKTVFAPSARYARATFTFTPDSHLSLCRISNFQLKINITQAVDSGSVDALSTDAGGTLVNFNKSFKDIDSITLAVEDVNPIYSVYDFVDIPNPTHFHVYCFDSTGTRVSRTVSWKARGIV